MTALRQIPVSARRLAACVVAQSVIAVTVFANPTVNPAPTLPPGSAASPVASADDVVFRASGARMQGKLLAADADFLRMEVEVIPGQPRGKVSVPRGDVLRVEFASRPDEEALLLAPSPANQEAIEKVWLEKAAVLSIDGSNAGNFALALGELLLQSGKEYDRTRALQLFQLVETRDWDADRQSRARGGRLKAMVLLGRAADAINEARKVMAETDDPAILIESNYVLAEASFAALQKLVEENPRWSEDIFVRPDYHRFFHEALDHYLFAYLFHGANEEAAVRGLLGAAKVWKFRRETDVKALEFPNDADRLARDLLALYPKHPRAAEAATFLESQEPKQTDESKL